MIKECATGAARGYISNTPFCLSSHPFQNNSTLFFLLPSLPFSISPQNSPSKFRKCKHKKWSVCLSHVPPSSTTFLPGKLSLD